MTAKHRGRSSDVCERNQNGPSKYPKIQTVCMSGNYWKYKHDTKFTNEDRKTKDILQIDYEDTSKLITILQNQCFENNLVKIKNCELQFFAYNSLQSLSV